MTGVFETQTLRVCPTEPIICVKEQSNDCPNFNYVKTFLNPNICRLHPNLNFCSQRGKI